MNAYELADEFKNRNWDEVDCVLWCEKAANMLRQQADRIAELEKFKKAILKKGGYPYKKSNPIAWMSPDGKVSTTEGILFHIPLYTTPQIKELSDEEILNVAFCCEVNTVAIENDWDGTVLQFAREILKKASEK